jgi:hypothetical protein
MSNQNNSNNITSSSLRHLFTLAACAGIVTSAVSGLVVSKFDFQSLPSKAATPNSNSLDVIVGQVDTGSNIEVSLCVKTDPTNVLHISDATNQLVYTPATLTPSPTILAAGNYGGVPPTAATSYAPLTWRNVLGTTDQWSLDITYTGGTGALLSTTTPELVGKVQFAKTGAGTVTLGTSEYFSLETATGPMMANVISFNGACTAYGTTTTTSSSAAPVIGTPNTANSLNTTVGGQAPTINLVGNTFSEGTAATFTPAGSTTALTGKISGGNFVPDQGQVIPANALTGAQNGTLRVAGLSLLIPTNFAAVVVSPTSNGGGATITIGVSGASQATVSSVVSSTTPAAVAPVAPVTPVLETNPQAEVTIKAPTANLKIDTQSGYDTSYESFESVRTGGLGVNSMIILSIIITAFAATVFKMYRSNTKLKYNKNLKID